MQPGRQDQDQERESPSSSRPMPEKPIHHHRRPTADEVCSQAPAPSFLRLLLPPGPHVVTPLDLGHPTLCATRVFLPGLILSQRNSSQSPEKMGSCQGCREKQLPSQKSNNDNISATFQTRRQHATIYRLDGTRSKC